MSLNLELNNQEQNPLQFGSIFVCQKAMSSSSLNKTVLQNPEFPLSLHQAVDSKNVWDPCRRKKNRRWLIRPGKEPSPRLVGSRKRNESIVINDDIRITVVEIRGDMAHLGRVSPSPPRDLRGDSPNQSA
jgi:hypothetical protein